MSKVTVPAILREADAYLANRRRWTQGLWGYVRKHRSKAPVSGHPMGHFAGFCELVASDPDAKPCVCAEGAVFLAAARLGGTGAQARQAIRRLDIAAGKLYLDEWGHKASVQTVNDEGGKCLTPRVPAAAIRGKYNRVRLVFAATLGR